MPQHADAIGYLNDLVESEGKPWFTKLCDLVMYQGTKQLDEEHLRELEMLFTEGTEYRRPLALSATAQNTEAPTVDDRLEQLNGFRNFKGLKDILDVSFPKRITVIFGTNGSGKSSLCESLKVLGSPEQPNRPLHNVKQDFGTPPTFSYRLQSHSGPASWDESIGFGVQSAKVKFFDTAVADKSNSTHVDPDRIVKLSPYRLFLFEDVRAALVQFRGYLEIVLSEALSDLSSIVDTINSMFKRHIGQPLSAATSDNIRVLLTELKLESSPFCESDLMTLEDEITSLRAAVSEEGLKLLLAEKEDLEQLAQDGESLLQKVESCWELESFERAIELERKTTAQRVLLDEIKIPNVSDEAYRAFLDAVQTVCTLDHPEGDLCPLCKQRLGAREQELFGRYHNFLIGRMEVDIRRLQGTIRDAHQLYSEIEKYKNWDPQRNVTVPEDQRIALGASIQALVSQCSLSEPPSDALNASRNARQLLKSFRHSAREKARLHEEGSRNREAKIKELQRAIQAKKQMEYMRDVESNIGVLETAKRIDSKVHELDLAISSFTQLLQRLTRASSRAHDELMVSEFQSSMEREYLALTEKPLTSFGVELVKRGSEASVRIHPRVGSEDIGRVLSEGELRVHALVLFMAELENSSHPIVIFDDPITSFDYDYIANFSMRLRDFAVRHPARQIIVLTHNWDFFVNVQTTLNKANLGNHLSVQILEGCAVSREYKEKVTDLKAEIDALLSKTGELSRSEKEQLAGQMRRLVESVTNAYVFNGQRHQYKQKTTPVSDFHKFTKLVPLQPQEATKLSDLYAKLSVSEHDDPRNAYVNTDKAVFKTRYDEILKIEAALLARKPA